MMVFEQTSQTLHARLSLIRGPPRNNLICIKPRFFPHHNFKNYPTLLEVHPYMHFYARAYVHLYIHPYAPSPTPLCAPVHTRLCTPPYNPYVHHYTHLWAI